MVLIMHSSMFNRRKIANTNKTQRKEVRAPETKLKGRKGHNTSPKGSAVAWGGAGAPGGRGGGGAGSPNNFDKHV